MPASAPRSSRPARRLFTCRVAPGVDCDQPGLYEWRIEGVGIYIGKFKRIRRPTKE